ncbi:hypothetical protein GO755_14115 [Spirosoma sp. HMF4905]|uniref:Uncharacterized protein n=1 Tax=Spirosoma arboris TaxID=2682092 RepID=A0A7K1SBH4_9BACT|nr:Nif11-like leader peptide family natural product precursor [Spirosoma arboris]MVM31173.1 hypothetical protein [Spirosoma arboris]
MSNNRIPFRELAKMEKGEIPMTEEGRAQIEKWSAMVRPIIEQQKIMNLAVKNAMASLSSPSISAASSIINSVKPLLTIPASNFNIPIVKGFATPNIIIYAESIRKAFQPTANLLNDLRIHSEGIRAFFERLKNDPTFQERLKLLADKEKMFRRLLKQWEMYLVKKANEMPFESFAHHIEYACYDLIDYAGDNKELASLNDSDFISLFKDVVAKLAVEDELQFEQQKARHKQSPNIVLPVKTGKRQVLVKHYDNFTSIFRNPDDISSCVEALYKLETPVINDAGGWIGKKRGSYSSISVLVAWIEVLEIRAKIYPQIDRCHLAELLNSYFSGLNMGTKDPGMFNKQNDVQQQYKTIFLAMINK